MNQHADSARAGKLIYIVVFLCGAILMALEILGSRILAPSFGNSIFVWGSLISIVLAALSVGYWIGGKAADRWPTEAMLAMFIALPGINIALMPLYYRGLNEWIAQGAFGVRMGPLVSCAILFLVPSAFLGVVSPYAVRLHARAVASVGKTAGALYAVSTMGSIAGTLATSFWLIAVFEVSLIVHVLGVLLLIIAATMLLAERHLGRAAVTLACTAILTAVIVWQAQAANSRPGVLLEEDSFYNHLMVIESATQRALFGDNTRQSVISLADPWKLESRYTQAMAVALALRPDPSMAPRRVLNIGVGGGVFAKRLYLDYPNVIIDAVDIDPKVLAVARKYFYAPQDDRFRLHAVDGRRFLQESRDLYDVIILDAYQSDTVPFHLTTREFYREVATRLAPGGVVASNIIAAVEGNGRAYFGATHKTLRSVFPFVYTFPVIISSTESLADRHNVILVAAREGLSPNAAPVSRADVIERVRRLNGKLEPFEQLAGYASAMLEVPPDVTGAPLLTDNYAPVDALLAEAL